MLNWWTNLIFVVHRAEIDYMRPAPLDDVLMVEAQTIDVGRMTVLVRQTLRGPTASAQWRASGGGPSPNSAAGRSVPVAMRDGGDADSKRRAWEWIGQWMR
jgi:acyl-CoA hydrolase